MSAENPKDQTIQLTTLVYNWKSFVLCKETSCVHYSSSHPTEVLTIGGVPGTMENLVVSDPKHRKMKPTTIHNCNNNETPHIVRTHSQSGECSGKVRK